ncbi:BMC domain-containing protein [Clostridium gasigenes]|uniref:BMC domain-containing protein n=1 Tax=Clostridium gasigenes TaxID=94869 RepID=UPI0014382646|nr:BMC domain-containing protein [Clostridium gasigenes]NKF06823.1 BMC domain-containing protein [Clostridium gasigenes]QSW19906.1 BMC domain-containing protein [Clostridium gasigenes]
MSRAVAIVELRSIASGISVVDKMLKAADVEPLYCKPICPGKFFVIVCGDVGSVNAALEAALKENNKYIISTKILPNIHEDIINAIKNKYLRSASLAIGIVETISVAEGIVALDTSLKNGEVTLVKLSLGFTTGGKCYYIVSGQLSGVKEAIECALKVIKKDKLLCYEIIPSPDTELLKVLNIISGI